MAHGFRRVDREQQFLLPPDVREWLPRGHLALLVVEAVAQLDMSGFKRRYRLGGAGRQAYDPAMLVGLLLYAHAIGVRSSRRIEQACETDVAFRVLAANQRPDHATIARFRVTHQQALVGLHVQVLGLCIDAGLVDARVVAVDSTRVAANASRSANLTRRQLREAVEKMFEEAARIDAEEDARYGPERRGDEPAPGWEPGPGRAARIRQALRQLDEQPEGQDDIDARQAARVAAGHKPAGRPRLPADPSKPGRVASKRAQTPQANTTDPDSRLMKSPTGFVQGYSCQAVATAGQIIVAAHVTNDHNDNRALRPMLAQAQADLAAAGGDAHRLRVALADRGYWNRDEIEALEHDTGVVALVATVRDRDLRGPDPPQPPRQPSLADMHRRMQHPSARRLYRRRAVMIEPVFGQRKTNRSFVRFLRRGLEAVRAEWAVEVTAHNLTKLWRAQPAIA